MWCDLGKVCMCWEKDSRLVTTFHLAQAVLMEHCQSEQSLFAAAFAEAVASRMRTSDTHKRQYELLNSYSSSKSSGSRSRHSLTSVRYCPIIFSRRRRHQSV